MVGERYRAARGDARRVGPPRRRACCCSPARAPQTLDGRADGRRAPSATGVAAPRARPPGWAVEPAARAVRARRRRGARRASPSRSAQRRAARRRRVGRQPASCASSPRSAAPTPRARRGADRARAHPDPDAALVDADVRAGAARARDRRRRGSATSPGRATRCRPACAASATTSRCSATRRWPPARRRSRASTRSSSACAPSTPSERLRAAHAALMAYVERGGTLVVQYNTNNRLAPLTGAARPLAVRDRPEARHRRDRGGHARGRRSTRRSPRRTAIGAARLRGLGAGARPLLRRQVGPALRDAARDARSRRAAARGRPALGAPRQGDVRLHRPRLLPAAPGRRAGRLPAVRQPARRRAAAHGR